MNSLEPLIQIAGVETAGWVTDDGDVTATNSDGHQADSHLLSAAQAVASIRQTITEPQPGANEIFIRFSQRSLFVRNVGDQSLVVICRDSISVPTLRTAIRKILQAKPPASRPASPPQTAPPRKRKSTRTGIWG